MSGMLPVTSNVVRIYFRIFLKDSAPIQEVTVNQEEVQKLSKIFEGRTIWLASCMHPGEEKSENKFYCFC